MNTIAHASAHLAVAARYLRDSGEPILAGLINALEHRVAAVNSGTPDARTRQAVQHQGELVAIESTQVAINRLDRPVTRADVLGWVQAAYRTGIETGADAIMADRLTPADHDDLQTKLPPRRLHSYTANPDGELVRLDSSPNHPTTQT